MLSLVLLAGCQTGPQGVQVNFTQLYRAWRERGEAAPSRKNVEALLALMTAAQHNDLGVLYEREGRLTDAQREYSRAIEKDYRFTRAYINLGNLLRKQGDYKQALERYRQALTLEPQSFEAANNFADLCGFLNANLEEAIARLQPCLSAAGDKTAYGLDTLGWLQHLQGADAEAAQTLERARNLAPANEKPLRAAVSQHLAAVYDKLGRAEESAAAAQEARALEEEIEPQRHQDTKKTGSGS